MDFDTILHEEFFQSHKLEIVLYKEDHPVLLIHLSELIPNLVAEVVEFLIELLGDVGKVQSLQLESGFVRSHRSFVFLLLLLGQGIPKYRFFVNHLLPEAPFVVVEVVGDYGVQSREVVLRVDKVLPEKFA